MVKMQARCTSPLPDCKVVPVNLTSVITPCPSVPVARSFLSTPPVIFLKNAIGLKDKGVRWSDKYLITGNNDPLGGRYGVAELLTGPPRTMEIRLTNRAPFLCT